MANGMVKVTLIGTLGKDPEVKFAASGTAVCNMSVACTERVRNKEGNWEDHTEWVRLVCFGKTAENAGQYLAKGRQVYAEGRLQTREWTDKDGNKRQSTEVIVNQLLFIGGGGGGKQDSKAPSPTAAPAQLLPQLSADAYSDIPF